MPRRLEIREHRAERIAQHVLPGGRVVTFDYVERVYENSRNFRLYFGDTVVAIAVWEHALFSYEDGARSNRLGGPTAFDAIVTARHDLRAYLQGKVRS